MTENPIKHEVRAGHVICGRCGARTHHYNPRVGRNRTSRVCEHKDPKTGRTCPASRQPLR